VESQLARCSNNTDGLFINAAENAQRIDVCIQCEKCVGAWRGSAHLDVERDKTMQFSRRKFMQSTAAVPGLALAAGAAAQEAGRPAIGEPGHFDTLARKTPVRPHSVDLDSNYIRMPLAPQDAEYGRLQGEHIKSFVRDLPPYRASITNVAIAGGGGSLARLAMVRPKT